MPRWRTPMLRYSRALPVVSVAGKAMRRHVLRRLAVALLGVALLAASPDGSRADDAGAAAAFLASLTDQVIEQLTDASLPVVERERSFRNLFRANFDIPAIGRFVLGRYWRKARPEVRKDFLSAFEEIMAQGFAARFAGYADTKFEVVSVQALKRAGQFKVRSRIAPTKDEVYLVGWLVEHKIRSVPGPRCRRRGCQHGAHTAFGIRFGNQALGRTGRRPGRPVARTHRGRTSENGGAVIPH